MPLQYLTAFAPEEPRDGWPSLALAVSLEVPPPPPSPLSPSLPKPSTPLPCAYFLEYGEDVWSDVSSSWLWVAPRSELRMFRYAPRTKTKNGVYHERIYNDEVGALVHPGPRRRSMRTRVDCRSKKPW